MGTVRHVESMVRISEANARMELRNKIEKRDIDHAISTMLESWCQTLKHHQAQEMRKKFRHFISAVQNHFLELHGLLSRLLTKVEIQQTNAARTSANNDEEDVPKVYVKKERLMNESKQFKLEESVDNYIKSDLFTYSFIFEKSRDGEQPGVNLGFIRRRTEEDE